MNKITIYGKESAVALETINNVEEHYCTNGMFYVRAEGQEFYFSLEVISVIRVETESEDAEDKYELGYNCGYADAMNDIAGSEGNADDSN